MTRAFSGRCGGVIARAEISEQFPVHGIRKTIAQWSKLSGVDQKMMRHLLINNRLTGWLEAA